MLIDLHCHTTRSHDSEMMPEDAVSQAKAVGLDGICFTEHDYLWPQYEIELLKDRTGYPIFNGIEVSTEKGHVIAVGLQSYDRSLQLFRRLAEAVEKCDGALIMAHPYRRYYRTRPPPAIREKDLAIAIKKPGLELVDALEIYNGVTRDIENELAGTIAKTIGKPTTGGGDAHEVDSVGRCYTEFDVQVSNERELAAAIKSGCMKGQTKKTLSG